MSVVGAKRLPSTAAVRVRALCRSSWTSAAAAAASRHEVPARRTITATSHLERPKSALDGERARRSGLSFTTSDLKEDRATLRQREATGERSRGATQEGSTLRASRLHQELPAPPRRPSRALFQFDRPSSPLLLSIISQTVQKLGRTRLAASRFNTIMRSSAISVAGAQLFRAGSLPALPTTPALVRPASSTLSSKASTSCLLPTRPSGSLSRSAESRRAIHIPYVEDTVRPSCAHAAQLPVAHAHAVADPNVWPDARYRPDGEAIRLTSSRGCSRSAFSLSDRYVVL